MFAFCLVCGLCCVVFVFGVRVACGVVLTMCFCLFVMPFLGVYNCALRCLLFGLVCVCVCTLSRLCVVLFRALCFVCLCCLFCFGLC